MGSELIAACQALLSYQTVLVLLIGVPLGIMVGVLPGIGAAVGVTVLLPLTFNMDPLIGIVMLVAVYCGAFYGGAVSAVLINTPGTPSNICTTMDGYPMARKGQAQKALAVAVVSSFIGGMISVFVLTLTAPLIATAALKFSYTERFAVAVFGIIMVVTTTSRKDFLKGLIMGVFGLFLACVGQDQMGSADRFTFNILALTKGIPLLPVVVGLFAISQALKLTEQGFKKVTLMDMRGSVGLRQIFAQVLKHFSTLLKSSLIGTVVGAIPGTGAAISTFIAYAEAKRTSKHSEEFGEGAVEGIIASESSNNSVTGGALIPLLTLGIPGDPITAIMLGAFLVHGLIPGPNLFIEAGSFVYGIFISMMAIYVLILIFGFYCARPFAAICKVREAILVPVILVISFVGSYAVNSSFFDVILTLIFGLLGYILNRYRFPLPPIIMGLVLGPMAEEGLRQSLAVSQGSWMIFASHPISAVFLTLSIIIVLFRAYKLIRDAIKGPDDQNLCET